MQTIKLLIADVDGTLLTREKILTERALAAARSLRRAGVRLALTSGRPPRGLSVLVKLLDIDVPLAASSEDEGFACAMEQYVLGVGYQTAPPARSVGTE